MIVIADVIEYCMGNLEYHMDIYMFQLNLILSHWSIDPHKHIVY